MMPDTVIARYQPGGDIYANLSGQYGIAPADIIAEAARTGDRFKVTDALALVRRGQPLEESTSVILIDQLITDPLAAPLAAADAGIKQIFASTTGKVVTAVAIVGLIVVVLLYIPKPAR
jgi:hypothetical protein